MSKVSCCTRLLVNFQRRFDLIAWPPAETICRLCEALKLNTGVSARSPPLPNLGARKGKSRAARITEPSVCFTSSFEEFFQDTSTVPLCSLDCSLLPANRPGSGFTTIRTVLPPRVRVSGSRVGIPFCIRVTTAAAEYTWFT